MWDRERTQAIGGRRMRRRLMILAAPLPLFAVSYMAFAQTPNDGNSHPALRLFTILGPLVLLMIFAAWSVLSEWRSSEVIVPSMLPPAPPTVGRSIQLSKLREYLVSLRRDSRPRLVQIVGEPGLGKTTLAVDAARSVTSHYAGGVLFATVGAAHLRDSSRDAVTKAILKDFIQALQRGGTAVPNTLEGCIERFRALTSKSRRGVLVLLDNVPNAAAVKNLLPSGPASGVIVTSRKAVSLPDWHVIPVAALSPEDSLTLLVSIIGEQRLQPTSGADPNADADAAREIVKRCGGSPLAIRLAGAALVARPHWSLARAAEGMETVRMKPRNKASGVFDFSFALLTEQEQNALVALGLLEERVFEPWMLATLLGLPNDEEAVAWRLSDRLATVGLLETIMNDATGATEYRILEQVHEYARLRARDPSSPFATRADVAKERLKQARRARGTRDLREIREILTGQVYPALEKGYLTRSQNYALDALTLARETIARAEAEVDRTAGGAGSTSARNRLEAAQKGERLALAALAEVRTELGGVDDALALCKQARGAAFPEADVRALRCMGKLYRRKHQFADAQKVLAEAAEVADSIDERSELARVYRETAIMLGKMGHTAEALKIVDEGLSLDLPAEVARRLRPSLLWAKALVIADGSPSRHEDADAEQILAEALEIARELGQRLWAAWIELLLARVLRQADRLEQSRMTADRAMELFGQMRHRYGVAWCRLEAGRSYRTADRLSDAILRLEEARQSLSTCDDRWMEACAAFELGEVLIRSGQESDNDASRLSAAVRELRLADALFEQLGDSASRERVTQALKQANRALADRRTQTSTAGSPPIVDAAGFWHSNLAGTH
ncbi:NB-ARC domain-containing protein [Hamadaea flava]|uniref:NB-ARC domain-containing protein n=1 Tax=Hamadaea flava TaxID=1742688 RepID=A0ABV8M173_9ACTN|nr:tetratricopeptide repeat protein [Hamadaea flava]